MGWLHDSSFLLARTARLKHEAIVKILVIWTDFSIFYQCIINYLHCVSYSSKQAPTCFACCRGMPWWHQCLHKLRTIFFTSLFLIIYLKLKTSLSHLSPLFLNFIFCMRLTCRCHCGMPCQITERVGAHLDLYDTYEKFRHLRMYFREGKSTNYPPKP